MRNKPRSDSGTQRQKGGEGVDLQEIREDLMDRFPQWTERIGMMRLVPSDRVEIADNDGTTVF